MNASYSWYRQLKKPSWAPPSFLFGLVWSTLYVLIFISFGYVFYKVYTGRLPVYTAYIFIANLIFNAAFTRIQFGIKNNLLALVDIVFVVVTLIWCMITIYPIVPWVALINIPYLLWVSFATVLQANIVYLNKKK